MNANELKKVFCLNINRIFFDLLSRLETLENDSSLSNRTYNHCRQVFSFPDI